MVSSATFISLSTEGQGTSFFVFVFFFLSKMALPMVPFSTGSPIMLCGPTGTGKTVWTKKLLSFDMFTEKVNSILYCYGVDQPLFEQMEMPNLTFHEGLPTLDKVKDFNDGKFNVIVLDDLMELVIKNVDAQNLFTKYCHHYNISVIFLTQNVFAQGPSARTISVNTHILVLFKNKRDESQIVRLAKQLCPDISMGFLECFQDATEEPFGYLVVDCDPKSPNEIKLRTKIFPGEETIVYLKK